MPIWICLIFLVIIVGLVAAAVVLPVYFLVVNKPGNVAAEPSTDQCRNQLVCANGGTIVVTQGKCMCICSFGFIGSDCTIPSAQGCTTTSINTPDSIINNVTIGQAIPRLVENAQTNFSIPLSATAVTAKFNSANTSCATQNALVTFDGNALGVQNNLVEEINGGINPTLVQADLTTVLPDSDVTITINDPAITDGADLIVSTFSTRPQFTGSISTILDTTIYLRTSEKESDSPTPTMTPSPTMPYPTTTASSSTSTTSQPTPTFTVNSQVIDFARVAVLYIFQEETLDEASTAQNSIQRFFADVESDDASPGVTIENAANLTIGGTNTIDLVNFFLDLGGDRLGGGPSS